MFCRASRISCEERETRARDLESQLGGVLRAREPPRAHLLLLQEAVLRFLQLALDLGLALLLLLDLAELLVLDLEQRVRLLLELLHVLELDAVEQLLRLLELLRARGLVGLVHDVGDHRHLLLRALLLELELERLLLGLELLLAHLLRLLGDALRLRREVVDAADELLLVLVERLALLVELAQPLLVLLLVVARARVHRDAEVQFLQEDAVLDELDARRPRVDELEERLLVLLLVHALGHAVLAHPVGLDDLAHLALVPLLGVEQRLRDVHLHRDELGLADEPRLGDRRERVVEDLDPLLHDLVAEDRLALVQVRLRVELDVALLLVLGRARARRLEREEVLLVVLAHHVALVLHLAVDREHVLLRALLGLARLHLRLGELGLLFLDLRLRLLLLDHHLARVVQLLLELPGLLLEHLPELVVLLLLLLFLVVVVLLLLLDLLLVLLLVLVLALLLLLRRLRQLRRRRRRLGGGLHARPLAGRHGSELFRAVPSTRPNRARGVSRHTRPAPSHGAADQARLAAHHDIKCSGPP